ncbi:MAG: hypothetical protein H7A25_00340 [Leptospiraceae bacterium]|nr:hypothetical protein [Leptospiraceae bacterium]MCP5498324.1 hypothetical protein [Leptospiraceae bacterium]
MVMVLVDYYLFFSSFIGLVSIVSAILLIKEKGKFTDGLSITSIFEFIWFPISILALIFLNFTSTQVLVPLVYILYVIISFYFSSKLLQDLDPEVDGIESINVPLHYSIVEGLFGACFFALSTYFRYVN